MRATVLLIATATLLASCVTTPASKPNRLVILSDGAVITIDEDGENSKTISDAEDRDFFQPVWSPDRSLLAFSSGPEDPAIHVARLVDGSVFATDTGTFPFYFSWSVGNDLAMLRSDSVGLRLDTTALDGESLGALDMVESGQPLYYSWSPDGSEVVAHIGTDRLLTSDLTTSVPLGVEPGAFQAPSWSEQGIIAVGSGPTPALSLVDNAGAVTRVASVTGSTTFLPNFDTSLIAVQSLGDTGSGQTVALQTLPRIPLNRLAVIDVESGEVVSATTSPVLAYFWSPVDNQLLVLDIVDGPAARWSVWSEGGTDELARFTPEPSFLGEFVPFFDQYAQSVSLWAPDGSAFAFPGAIGDQSGVWLQHIDGDDAVRIHDGSWVSWAP